MAVVSVSSGEKNHKLRIIYNIFFGNKHDDSVFSNYEVFSLIISLIGSFIFYLDLKLSKEEIEYLNLNNLFNLFILFFIFDYAIRFYSCVCDPRFASGAGHRVTRVKWVFHPENLFDLISFVPSLILGPVADLRFLRLMRFVFLFFPGGGVCQEAKEFWERHRSESLRKKIYLLLFQHSDLEPLQHFVERFLMVVIFCSIMSVILESMVSLNRFHDEFRVLDAVLVAIFSVEYVLRIIVCVESPELKNAHFRHLRGALRGTQIIDLLSILPFYLSIFLPSHLDLRFLRVLRLFPALKLIRYSRASRTLIRVLSEEWPVIAAAIFIMGIFVIMTASIGYMLEHEAQPEKFENIPQSIYWAAITLASVGYGDISPLTPSGRIMTVLAALIGIGIFALPAAILSSSFIEQMHRDREILREDIHASMASGELSDEQRHEILKKSEESSLSEAEINRIIDQEIIRISREVKHRQNERLESLPRWPDDADEAFEQFRHGVIWLRRTQFDAIKQDEIEALLNKPDAATGRERAVWKALKNSE